MDARIKQIQNIERKARKIRDDAAQESERVLLEAEQEVVSMIENARSEAQKEARTLIAGAEAREESARILAEAEGKSAGAQRLAAENFERVVRFVLDQAAGRE
jgi:F-type H+-transporting ATPase subunit b